MTEPNGNAAPRVSLFVTCVGELAEPAVPIAAVRVLRAVGCDVDVPAGQTCCGQPAWNSGFTAEAAAVARTSLDALSVDEDAVVVVPAGSCATMIKLYWPQLFSLAGDEDAAARARSLAERVQEFTEFLDQQPRPALAVSPRTVVYHRSCHMLRELHVEDQPDRVLADVEGCSRADWPTDAQCCGFGGTFSVKLPETSVAMADEKLDTIPDGVDVIVGADASCLMQLRTRAEARDLDVTTVHIAQLVEEGLPTVDEAER